MTDIKPYKATDTDTFFKRFTGVSMRVPMDTGDLPAYEKAVVNFFNAINYPIPDPFRYPIAFFYYPKRRPGLRSYRPFFFARSQSIVVSERTFPSFLLSLGIPAGSDKLRNALLHELTNYVKAFEYDIRSKHFSEILANDMGAAKLFYERIVVDSEKNLFFYSGKMFEPVQPISLMDFASFRIKQSSINEYLSEVVREPKGKEDRSDWPPRFQDRRLHYYWGDNKIHFRSIYWKDGYSSNQYESYFPEKALLSLEYPAYVPGNAAAWLYHLTGGKQELTDQLADILAKASEASSDGKKATVIYTRHNTDEIISLLETIYGPLLCSYSGKIHASAELPLPTFNQVCKTNSLADLYLQQASGKGVFLLRDHPISDVAKPMANKLISGSRLIVTIPGYPKQNLYNRVHFICISQNYAKAFSLSKRLKIELLDLSGSELPMSSLPALTDEDIAWLRMIFLPYGLKDHVPLSKPKKSTPDSDYVREFLLYWCKAEEGELYDRHDLYDAYCICYRYSHQNMDPPLSKGRFVKAVKSQIGRGAFSNVKYYKERSEQLMYFKGLVPYIPQLPEKPSSPPAQDPYMEYLQGIHDDVTSGIKGLPFMQIESAR